MIRMLKAAALVFAVAGLGCATARKDGSSGQATSTGAVSSGAGEHAPHGEEQHGEGPGEHRHGGDHPAEGSGEHRHGGDHPAEGSGEHRHGEDHHGHGDDPHARGPGQHGHGGGHGAAGKKPGKHHGHEKPGGAQHEHGNGKSGGEGAASSEASPIGKAQDLAADFVGKLETCPVTNERFKVEANTPALRYGGKTYVFCCGGCAQEFQDAPASFLTNAK